MRTPTSSARARLALAFAAAALAAAAGGSASAAGAAQDGKPPLGSGTCRVCHTDRDYGPSFSHAGLESSGDGCLTCHGDGAAHVAARGGKGSIPIPKALAPEAERELCLGCHEEETYAAPKHLEPRGKDARCTGCHEVHGGAKPARGGAAAPPGPVPPVPAPGEAPARGGAWGKGRIEAGWRFVGNEEGRYEQDIGLEDGPRLFGLDLEGGSSAGDPRASRAEFHLDGLGDPHASMRASVRESDSWRASIAARSDERPFLAQSGLHGGETLRRRLSADLSLRLSEAVRAGIGYGALDVDGEVRGTLLDNGSLVPVAADQDRLAQEGWADVDVRGKGWHAGLRQGWIEERGDDTRSRQQSVPGAPDSLRFDDDSTMDGPVTAVRAGADLYDGDLALEARASRSDLARDVDLSESRRSVLAGVPYSRDVLVDGSRDRLVDSLALDAVLAFAGRWALETGAFRRVLREDGVARAVTTEDTGGGPVTTVRDTAGRVSQRVTGEYARLRRDFEGGLFVRAGADFLQDALDDGYDAAASRTVRTTGLFAETGGPVGADVSVRGLLRTARGSDVFTPLTPEDGSQARLGASWRSPAGWRAGLDGGWSGLAASDSDLASSGYDVRASAGADGPGGITADLAATLRRLTLEVDTLSYRGTALGAGEATSRVRTAGIEGSLGFPLSPALGLLLSGHWVRDEGSLPVRAWDASLALRWEITRNFAARVEVRRAAYAESGSDLADYEADVLEVSLETRF